RWSEKAEIGVGRFIPWLGVTASKFYDWRQRYGCVNEHNGWVPRDFWLEPWEKEAIIEFHLFCGGRCYVALGTRLRLGMHVNGPERHIISSEGFAGTALARRPFSNASAERRGSRRLRALWPSSLDRLRRKRL